jgi:hypothetical protein
MECILKNCNIVNLIQQKNKLKNSNMKKLIVYLFMAGLSVSAFAQNTTVAVPKIPVDSNTKKITYTEVVQQTGNKDSLYKRAIHWCNTFFKNPQDVTKLRDSDNGKIEGIYRFKIYNPPLKDGTPIEAGMISFTFTIECKENKYRYKITDLNLKGSSYYALEKWLNKKDPSYKPEDDNYLVQVDKYMKDFAVSIKKGMLQVKQVNDNW